MAGEDRKDVRSLSYEELAELLLNMGYKRYRCDQIFGWLHHNLVSDFSEMSNIPKELKERLSQDYTIYGVTKELVKISKLDGTRKYLWRLHDGNIIESVFMRYEHGNSVCVSSQVGCKMGCRFCASTIDGLVRNLSAGEMLGQVYEIEKDTGERVSNIVIMGVGEPLDNYDNAVRFIRLLNDERGLHISQRNITLSTCGLVDQIGRLKAENLSITLALSLHAADDAKRRELMPVARKYSIAELLEACRDYYDAKNRRITFEYSLIEGFNDTDEDVRLLAALLQDMNAHINLIPVNPVRERDFKEPGRERIRAFQNKLEKNHINVTIRRELGRDIEGACGQLRRSYIKSVEF